MSADLRALTEIRADAVGKQLALAALYPSAPPAKRKCPGRAVPRESTGAASSAA